MMPVFVTPSRDRVFTNNYLRLDACESTLLTLVLQSRFDSYRSGFRIVVLPYSYNHPPGFLETPIGVAISLLVPLNFRAPEDRIRLGLRSMQGTPMPKASINKYGDFLFPEDNICPSAKVRQWLLINDKFQSNRLQCSA